MRPLPRLLLIAAAFFLLAFGGIRVEVKRITPGHNLDIAAGQHFAYVPRSDEAKGRRYDHLFHGHLRADRTARKTDAVLKEVIVERLEGAGLIHDAGDGSPLWLSYGWSSRYERAGARATNRIKLELTIYDRKTRNKLWSCDGVFVANNRPSGTVFGKMMDLLLKNCPLRHT